MFRFSIRDLLWLTLVVAMGLGWLVRERTLQSDVTQTQLDCDAKCIAHAEREKTCHCRIEALEGESGGQYDGTSDHPW
jgi:hypothetical protein